MCTDQIMTFTFALSSQKGSCTAKPEHCQQKLKLCKWQLGIQDCAKVFKLQLKDLAFVL